MLKWSCPVHLWIPEPMGEMGRQAVPRTPWKWGAGLQVLGSGWGSGAPPSDPTSNRAGPSARHCEQKPSGEGSSPRVGARPSVRGGEGGLSRAASCLAGALVPLLVR